MLLSSKNFSVVNGDVRQGYPSSLFLFNFVVEDVLLNAFDVLVGDMEILSEDRVVFGLVYSSDIILRLTGHTKRSEWLGLVF